MPTILINLVADITPGLIELLLAICWLLGLTAFASGLFRLKRHSEGGSVRPAGTAMTFLLAFALLALPAMLDAAAATLFGSTPAPGQLLAWGATPDSAGFNAALGAAVVVVQLVGLIAFAMGWFALRDAAEGRGGGFATGIWRITGGVLCWHIVPFTEAVQDSLGVSVLNVR